MAEKTGMHDMEETSPGMVNASLGTRKTESTTTNARCKDKDSPTKYNKCHIYEIGFREKVQRKKEKEKKKWLTVWSGKLGNWQMGLD